MRLRLLALLCAALPAIAPAKAEDFSGLPIEGAAHVPAGWRLLDYAVGDLNADGWDDLVMVFEDLDPSKITMFSKTSDWIKNMNARKLSILFRGPDGFEPFGEYTNVIPPAAFLEDPGADDPYYEVGIERGVLRLQFLYVRSGSGWAVDEWHKFRLERGRFRLIGSESDDHWRVGLHRYFTSINYLTRRVKRSSIMLTEELHQEWKESWTDLPAARQGPYYIETVPFSVRFDE